MAVPEPQLWPAAFQAVADGAVAARIGRPEVEAATAILSFFSDADAAFGGGRALTALSGYLSTVVSGWLRRPSRAADHQALLSVAGSLCYLAGFACLDQRSQAAAQRYYLLSLRLMHEAGDTVGYGIALRAMSVQARLLGHHAESVTLAEAATAAVGTRAPALTRAFLIGQTAVARAAADDPAGAARDLHTAAELLAQATLEPVAIGRYDSAALAHAEASVAAAGGRQSSHRTPVRVAARPPRHRPALARGAERATRRDPARGRPDRRGAVVVAPVLRRRAGAGVRAGRRRAGVDAVPAAAVAAAPGAAELLTRAAGL
ncbi:hypothetical protein ACFQ9X_26625 [Catenulispora yoronensis]